MNLSDPSASQPVSAAPLVPAALQIFLALDFGMKRTGFAVGNRLLRTCLLYTSRCVSETARMVEFESISERLYGVVRQAAKDFDKQVKLDIVGGSLDMDRGVLERVAAAFEHLLRNAVGHGIEPASVRVAAGKPPVGVITITCLLYTSRCV